jgi:hypothetical protein
LSTRRHDGSRRRSGSARSDRLKSGGEDAATIVRETLAGYAQRGIFRAYGDRPASREQIQFSFRWHTEVPINVVYRAGTRELAFRDLLPDVGGNSAMYRHLKQFLRERTSQDLPPHRRIDPRKVALRLTQRAGKVSLIVSLESDVEYGVRKAVNLIHELFVNFLRDPLYFSYMVQHFGLNPDM